MSDPQLGEFGQREISGRMPEQTEHILNLSRQVSTTALLSCPRGPTACPISPRCPGCCLSPMLLLRVRSKFSRKCYSALMSSRAYIEPHKSRESIMAQDYPWPNVCDLCVPKESLEF